MPDYKKMHQMLLLASTFSILELERGKTRTAKNMLLHVRQKTDHMCCAEAEKRYVFTAHGFKM